MPELRFRIDRWLVSLYALLALVFSVLLLAQATRRGDRELAFWLLAYAAVAVLGARWPQAAPLGAGLLAFVLGFDRTHSHGINLDLGLCLILLAMGLHLLRRRPSASDAGSLDLGSLALLALACWSVVSCAFTLARIRSFTPAPGFSYHVYRFNPRGQSSEEALVAALAGAAATFAGFGLYEYARSLSVDRRALRVAVFAALAANSAALGVQRYLDPAFLQPAGLPPINRLNGLTSFCYALGDVTAVLFLLLPVWGAVRGLGALLTLASVAFLAHATFASGSRLALLAIVAASLAWAAQRAVRLGRARRRLAALGLLAAGLALAFGLVAAYRLTPADSQSPFGRLRAGIEDDGLFGHLVTTRLSGYPLIFRLLREYPLSGVGAGLYQVEIQKQRELLAPGLQVQDPLLLTSYGPNQFLNVGAELGLPAMLALLVAFGHAGWVALSSGRRSGGSGLAVSLAVLAGQLMLGPSLYNSEALVFCWLIVGLVAQRAQPPSPAGGEAGAGWGPRVTAGLIAALLLLGVAGQWQAWPRLTIESQWRRLRWPMIVGMPSRQPEGQWTGAEATFTVDVDAPALLVRWHAGDAGAPAYRASVSFFVDGVPVVRTPAVSGRVLETRLPLPAEQGRKRISIQVSPPFVPALLLGGDDRRGLGVFLHTVTPVRPREGTP